MNVSPKPSIGSLLMVNKCQTGTSFEHVYTDKFLKQAKWAIVMLLKKKVDVM